MQRFFSQGGRAFCLYAVVGSAAPDDGLAAQAAAVVGGLSLAPA